MASVISEIAEREIPKIGILDLIKGKPKERKKILKEIKSLREEIASSELGEGIVTKTIDFHSPIDGLNERPVDFHNNHVRCGVTNDFICRS